MKLDQFQASAVLGFWFQMLRSCIIEFWGVCSCHVPRRRSAPSTILWIFLHNCPLLSRGFNFLSAVCGCGRRRRGARYQDSGDQPSSTRIESVSQSCFFLSVSYVWLARLSNNFLLDFKSLVLFILNHFSLNYWNDSHVLKQWNIFSD